MSSTRISVLKQNFKPPPINSNYHEIRNLYHSRKSDSRVGNRLGEGFHKRADAFATNTITFPEIEISIINGNEVDNGRRYVGHILNRVRDTLIKLLAIIKTWSVSAKGSYWIKTNYQTK